MTVENENYLYSQEEQKYYKLNETAYEIWNLITNDEEQTVDSVAQKMSERYVCDINAIKEDISDVINFFINTGALYRIVDA